MSRYKPQNQNLSVKGMKKIHLLLCILMCLHFASHAQKGNYYPGYIVEQDGDTVNGLIKKQSAHNYLQSCWFDPGGNPTQYLPGQISGYGFVNGRAFVSGIKPEQFVEVLIKGKMDLYKFKTDYYIKKNEDVYHIEARMDTVVFNDRYYVRDNLKWQGILSLLVSDCMQDMSEIQEAYFSERALTSIIKSYNECSGDEYLEIKARMPWAVVRFGAMAGLNLSRLNTYFDEDRQGYFDDEYYSLDPDIGLLLRISFPRISERLSVQAEIHYNTSRFYSYRELNDLLAHQYVEMITQLRTLSFPFSLRHGFPIRKSTANIEIGFSINRNLKNESYLIIEKQAAYSSIIETSKTAGIEITKSQPGLWAGIGFEKDFETFTSGIYLRYYTRVNEYAMMKGFEVNPDIFSLSLTFIKK